MKYLASLLMLAIPAFVNAGELSVTGEGVVTVTADVAYVHFSVNTEAKTSAQALEKNNLATNAVFATLKDLGIEKKDIKTSNLSISPKFFYEEKKEPRVVGYTASHSMQVTICDINNAGKVLDAVMKDGVNRLEGISFGASGDKAKEALSKARKAASADALTKAKDYFDALSVKGTLKSVGEVGSRSSTRGVPYMAFDSADPGEGRRLNVEGGQVSFTVQLVVTFELQ